MLHASADSPVRGTRSKVRQQMQLTVEFDDDIAFHDNFGIISGCAPFKMALLLS